MLKDFDSWNIQKKRVQENAVNKLYHEQEIWWCLLGINVGVEQDGEATYYDRPVLIIKAFSKHACLIVPLTTSKKLNPYHTRIGLIEGKEAFAIISQIRLIDTRRLIDKITFLDRATFNLIRKSVRDFF